ncbi:MAG: glycogen synthase [Bacilli bacterium]|nr:glycogen synthase [Bacilli bacterium]
MRIVMVTSEARPFCKTGGLADVAYSLSKELTVMGEEVSIILPFYEVIRERMHPNIKLVETFMVFMSWRSEEAKVYISYADGITYYFIENAHYFDRPNIYGDNDDGERFAFFTLAARELLYRLKNKPDIVHIHDWQPGMLPCLIKEDIYASDYFKNTKFVLTIHNPAFQGFLDRSALPELYNLPERLYDDGQVRFEGRVSTLKSAIVYSDIITTVSPTHRLELLSPEGGKGLDNILRMREWDFVGILNGIDYLEFNPQTDEQIPYNFTVTNVTKQKDLNRKALLEEMHLQDYDQPLFSMVTRITWQKGFDLVFYAVEELVNRGCNIVILGSGERDYERRWEELRARYPDKIAIYIGYSDALAHRIYAASDFFLMPSLFEPCGLGQMIAQRYGTLPIVRRTGGLKDSVINYDGNNQDTSNGFGFDAYDGEEMKRTCVYAYDAWCNKPLMKQLVKNAMKTNNSWTKSTKEYLAVYKRVLKTK